MGLLEVLRWLTQSLNLQLSFPNTGEWTWFPATFIASSPLSHQKMVTESSQSVTSLLPFTLLVFFPLLSYY